MPKAKKATDPSAPKKTTRTKKAVASASEHTETSPMNANTIPVEEQVRQRAFELYQQRGGTGGTAQEDWLQAEMEILGRRTA